MAAVTTNLTSHCFTQRQQLESTDGSMDSNDISNHYGRESPLDNNSCCSDDTVLSVGKETLPPNQPLSFKNIESHLNAISQLTNATLGSDDDHAKHYTSPTPSPNSPLSNRLSPMSTKSLESPSYAYKSDISETKSSPNSPLDTSYISPIFRPSLTSTSPEPSPKLLASPKSSSESLFFRQTPMKQHEANNDANPALKFSIDNILKADFGRRITDPLNIKKSKAKKGSLEEVVSSKVVAPVDLTKAETEKPTGSSESSNTSQPMLWPAWVYCTRYSDRPSSGKRFFFIFIVWPQAIVIKLKFDIYF